jgi:hypothetical protein
MSRCFGRAILFAREWVVEDTIAPDICSTIRVPIMLASTGSSLRLDRGGRNVSHDGPATKRPRKRACDLASLLFRISDKISRGSFHRSLRPHFGGEIEVPRTYRPLSRVTISRVFESTEVSLEMELPEIDLPPVSSSTQGARRQRSTFSQIEDDELTRLVGELGESKWKEIEQRMPGRTARQCRERWNLYLALSASNAPWSLEDDLRLIQLYQSLGPKWVSLAKEFPARTPNNLKNRHRQLQRKVQRITRFTGALLSTAPFGAMPQGGFELSQGHEDPIPLLGQPPDPDKNG